MQFTPISADNKVFILSVSYWEIAKSANTTGEEKAGVKVANMVVSSLKDVTPLVLANGKISTFFISTLQLTSGINFTGRELIPDTPFRSPTYHIGNVVSWDEKISYTERRKDISPEKKAAMLEAYKGMKLDGTPFVVECRWPEDGVTLVAVGDRVLDPEDGAIAFILEKSGPNFLRPQRPAGSLWKPDGRNI